MKVMTLKKIKYILPVIFLLAAMVPAVAATKVYSVYGLGGATWSGGMQAFGKPYQWNQASQIVADIKKQPKGTRIVCVGHSLGANTCSDVQRQVKVDLTVGLDPTWSYPVYPIRGKGINYYSTNYLNPLGHAKFTGKNVKNIPTSDIHTAITYDKKIISQVKRAIGGR